MTESKNLNPRKIVSGGQIEHPLPLIDTEISKLTPTEVVQFQKYSQILNNHLQSPAITLGEDKYQEYLNLLRKAGRLDKPIKPVNGAFERFFQ